MIDEIKKFIGVYPEEHGFKKRIRFHQGWWRAFVLAEEQGNHPINEDDYVCNMIRNGQVTNKNLLTSNVLEAVRQTIHERIETTSGIIAEDRLFNNLLSSQPLCFNFWGELKMDTDFALQVLKQFWPEITEVHKVIFEYAPKENYTEDNSAFDVAFEVMSKEKRGLIGLECKYTDSFSSKAYDRDAYKRI